MVGNVLKFIVVMDYVIDEMRRINEQRNPIKDKIRARLLETSCRCP